MAESAAKTAFHQIREELVKRREEVVHLQHTLEQRGAEINEEPGDVIDKSEQVEAWFSREGISQHVSEDLRRIDIALARMDRGEFGSCESCEDEIPLARLKARPDATLCVSCQETAEKHAAGRARRTDFNAGAAPFLN